MRFEIPFFGHANVRANHTRTIEITTEPDLTLQGDCIVGVGAEFGCKKIPDDLKEKLRRSDARITITILVNDEKFEIVGKGHEELKLENPHDIVIRKSNFTCPRTLSIGCDIASDAISRKMIKALQNPETKGIFRIEVK